MDYPWRPLRNHVSDSKAGTELLERQLLERNLLERHLLERVTSGIRKERCCRDLHCARIKRRRCHDDDPPERRRRHRKGTAPCGRGLASLHHRARWCPLRSLRVRQTAVTQPRTLLARVI